MKISVIIPSCNRIPELTKCIISVLKQKVLPYEILIIDNSIPSNNTKIKRSIIKLQSSTKVKLRYYHELNIGVSNCRNKGISKARGDILAFLDDDCIVLDGWCNEIINLIKKNKESIITGKILYDSQLGLLDFVQYYRSKRVFVDEIYRKNNKLHSLFVDTKNFIVRKKLIRKLSLIFDTSTGFTKFSACEDLDFSFQAKQKNIPILYSDKILVQHKSLTSFTKLMKREFQKGRAFYHFKLKWPKYRLSKSKLTFMINIFKDERFFKYATRSKLMSGLFFLTITFVYKCGIWYESLQNNFMKLLYKYTSSYLKEIAPL